MVPVDSCSHGFDSHRLHSPHYSQRSFFPLLLRNAAKSAGEIRMAFDTRTWRSSPRSQSRYTSAVLTPSRRATSRTESRAAGSIGSPPRARKRIELFLVPRREDGELRCSESVQQKCSKLLSNAGETELGPTIASSSLSEGNRGLPKSATLCHPSDGFSHGRGRRFKPCCAHSVSCRRYSETERG